LFDVLFDGFVGWCFLLVLLYELFYGGHGVCPLSLFLVWLVPGDL